MEPPSKPPPYIICISNKIGIENYVQINFCFLSCFNQFLLNKKTHVYVFKKNKKKHIYEYFFIKKHICINFLLQLFISCSKFLLCFSISFFQDIISYEISTNFPAIYCAHVKAYIAYRLKILFVHDSNLQGTCSQTCIYIYIYIYHLGYLEYLIFLFIFYRVYTWSPMAYLKHGTWVSNTPWVTTIY